MPLTQLELDLEKYALEKIHNAMKDVAQAFAIAGLFKGESLPLLDSIFIRASAQIAVSLRCSKQLHLERVGNVYDQEVARNQRHEEQEHAEKKQAQAQADGA